MLGKRIAEHRHRVGLSQAALADRLHISASALGMYEQGRRSPSAEILVALAAELGVSTDTLLGSPIPAGSEPLFSPIHVLLQHTRRCFSREELAVLCLALTLGSTQ